MKVTLKKGQIGRFSCDGDFSVREGGDGGIEVVTSSGCFIHHNPEPEYTHDCEKCVFLGRSYSDKKTFDVYYCLQGGFHPTIVARYGNSGPDYYSGKHLPLNIIETGKYWAKECGLEI